MRQIWHKALMHFAAGMTAVCIAASPVFAEEAHGAGVADPSQMAKAVELDLSGLTPVTADQLKEGRYEVQVDSSSSMFRITGAVIEVQGGEITAELTLGSTAYRYLFMGTAEEASAAESSEYIPYEENEDGTASFIIPVEALDKGIACAAFSRRKELWYDRTLVFRADSLDAASFYEGYVTTAADLGLEDGTYTVEVTLEGGSGRAYVESPAQVTVLDGEAWAAVTFSSPNYDYMVVEGEVYEPVNEEGNSAFVIPVTGFDYPMPVLADTTAMSVPYEISYTLFFDSASMKPDGSGSPGLVPEAEEEPGEMGSSLYPGEPAERPGAPDQTVSADQADTAEQGPNAHWNGDAEQAPSADQSYKKKADGNYCAAEFKVEGERGEIRRITIGGTDTYLLIPEGAEVPEDVPEGATVLKQPLRHIYLAASSGMDFFRTLNRLDAVLFTSTKERDWSMEEVRERMKSGELLYAGKYSAPDYELLLSLGTDLAIESTMIYHSPETKEQLERLGIPVLVERSSYEGDPLGRLEWIRLYGLLAGCEEEADAWYEAELRKLQSLKAEPTAKSVAFFHISPGGNVVVRKPGDYIPKMIGMAGGRYFLDENDAPGSSAASTMNMEMESFYEAARDADVIIYNSTIDGSVETIDDLLQKNDALRDFRAVREENVWCTEKNLFQQVTGIAGMIGEMNRILRGDADEMSLTFFHRVRP